MSLTNIQYDELMRKYQNKQRRRQQIIEERKKKLYKALPRVRELEEEIAMVSIGEAKARLMRPAESADGAPQESGHDGSRTAGAQAAGEKEAAAGSVHEQIEALRKQKLALMEENGFAPDYLHPPYDCPDCKDTGYIGNKRCHCFKQYAIDIVYRQANLTEVLEAENFKTFSLECYDDVKEDPDLHLTARENARSVLNYTKRYCESFKETRGNILLLGPTGLGKTFLTHCIAKELLSRGISVIYFSAAQFFDILEKNVFRHDPAVILDVDNIYSCDLLIIDDLGTEFSNSFTDANLFQVLNERLLRKKSLMISTNLSTGQIAERYSERTFSRIYSDFKVLKLFGDDIRIAKKLSHT